MVETAAESSEELMDAYLESGSLSEEQVRSALRSLTIANEIVPVMCGSAFKNKGVQAVLDGIVHYLPAPTDVAAIEGVDFQGNVVTRTPADEEPFSALAFKIATDSVRWATWRFLEFIRVLCSTGDAVFNPDKGKKERIGRILLMHSNRPRRD